MKLNRPISDGMLLRLLILGVYGFGFEMADFHWPTKGVFFTLSLWWMCVSIISLKDK